MAGRVRKIHILFIVISLCLAVRLVYIQVICGEELTEGAVSQQIIPVKTGLNRGTIYDRNMIPLIGGRENYYYIIENNRLDGKLNEIFGNVGGSYAGAKGNTYSVYKMPCYKKSIHLKLLKEYGACPVTIADRYHRNQTAEHFIGYINSADNEGVSGIERKYQSTLTGRDFSMGLAGNGKGKIVAGLGLSGEDRMILRKKTYVVTTIDKGLQGKIEDILKRNDYRGAVAVTQAKTGQILAMASSPFYDVTKIDRLLDSDKSELINKCISGRYPPGSVFKIVTAAAAINEDERTAAAAINTDVKSAAGESEGDLERLSAMEYFCNGRTTVNGVTLTCSNKPEGHGKVNLEKAMEVSCNCYFANLAKKLGGKKITEMACDMGFNDVTLDRFPSEVKGSLPDYNETSYGGIANFSIGQGSLLVTPVQVAKMTAIIANKGVDKGMYVTMDEPARSEKQVISEDNADRISKMLMGVCNRGTASGLNFNTEVAGKTGSAESSSHGRKTVHGWFTGFFPAKNPEYVVTVFIEDGETGRGTALPVFQEIVNYLYRK